MSISAVRSAISGYSDRCLVAMARQGDAFAFEELVIRYRKPLFDYAQRILGTRELAEDALQLALLQAWVALQRQHEVASVRPWLYRIVHNAALRTTASDHRDQAELHDDLVATHGCDAYLERRIAIRSALESIAALPVLQREALVLTAISGRSHDEAAAKMGLSAGAVRGLVHRARASLRAAAAAIMPLPVVRWLLPAGHRASVTGESAKAAAAGAGAAGGLAKVGAVVLATSVVVTGGVAVRHHFWLGGGRHHSPWAAVTAQRRASDLHHFRALQTNSSGPRSAAGRAPLQGVGSPSAARTTTGRGVTPGTSPSASSGTVGSYSRGSGSTGAAGGHAGAGGGSGASAGGSSAAAASAPPGSLSSTATTLSSSTTSTSDSNTAPTSSTGNGSSTDATSSASQTPSSSDAASGDTSQPTTSSATTTTPVGSSGSSTSLNQTTDSTAQPAAD